MHSFYYYRLVSLFSGSDTNSQFWLVPIDSKTAIKLSGSSKRPCQLSLSTGSKMIHLTLRHLLKNFSQLNKIFIRWTSPHVTALHTWTACKCKVCSTITWRLIWSSCSPSIFQSTITPKNAKDIKVCWTKWYSGNGFPTDWLSFWTLSSGTS